MMVADQMHELAIGNMLGPAQDSDDVSAAVPGYDWALTAATFKGQVEFLGPQSHRQLSEDQHLLHYEKLVTSQRPRLLGGCLEERDASTLIVDQQRTDGAILPEGSQ